MLKLAIPAWLRNAAAALCGRHGAVTERADQAACSRQTIYDHARRLVQQATEADPAGATLRAEVVRLQAERDALQRQVQQAVIIGPAELERFAVTGQAMGVSLRQAEELLGTLLPAPRVPDHATLGRWTEAAGRRAGQVLATLDALGAPAVRSLCADEIFFWGVATLVAVEPTSLALLECAKTGDRSAAAWQAVLTPFANLEFVVSDAAKGIAAGVAAVRSARQESGSAVALAHGLDVFHTNQEARRVLAGPWRRAEAGWDDAVAADAQVSVTKRQGEKACGVAQQARRAWEEAARLLAEVARPEAAWQRARAALAVFRPDGTLNERAWAEAEITAALADLGGPAWKKTRNFLTDRRTLAFLDRLQGRLAEAEPEPALRRAWVRRWWLRHAASRSVVPPATPLAQVQALLDAKVRDGELSAAEQASYQRVAAVLRTTVRASSAVEGINSVLRMQQGRHRKMTQGLLDLKRLYWNCRRLQTGKRRGRCPYEMLGVALPSTDFWTLLQSVKPPAVEQMPEKVSGAGDAE